MERSNTLARVIDALEAAAPQFDIDIVDVEITGTSQQPVLTVKLDHADEQAPLITLDEVAQQTSWVSDVVDALDPFVGSYVLEVSSPGMDRPLRKPRDFERFAGERVSLTTRALEGRRRYTGQLMGLKEGRVVIACDDGTTEIPLDEVKTCKIKPTFDFPKTSGKQGGHSKNEHDKHTKNERK